MITTLYREPYNGIQFYENSFIDVKDKIRYLLY